MAETEKITINMNIVELGQIDLLVEEGFYSNRTDFIRAATRSQLDQHKDAVRQTMLRRSMAVGAITYTRKDLERYQAAGERLEIRVVGVVYLPDDIPAELADETIACLQVFGLLRASDAVRAVLADRINI